MSAEPEVPAVAGEMTPAQRDEARRYGRAQLICHLADKGADLVYLGLAALVLARPLDRWLAQWVASDTLRLMLLFLITIGLHECVSFPLAWWSGHVLEHRYGLSRMTFRGWLWRHAKQYLLAVGFGLAMFTGLFWLIWSVGAWWWLAAGGAWFIASVVLGQLAPIVILPLFYRIERLDDEQLGPRLSRLAEGTGLAIEGVYRLDLSQETSKANAMLAGLGRSRRVLLGDTLLDRFSPEEIEVIFAHEIGHHVYRHLPKLILSHLASMLVGLWLCDRVLGWWIASGGAAYDPRQMPVWALPMLMWVLLIYTTLAEPLHNAVSRRFERQCDRYALARTGLREAYRSAFRKLAVLNKDDPSPHPLEVFWLHSHPPIAERLALADA